MTSPPFSSRSRYAPLFTGATLNRSIVSAAAAMLAVSGVAYAASIRLNVVSKISKVVIIGGIIDTPTILPAPTAVPAVPIKSPSGSSILPPSLNGIASVTSGIKLADYLTKSWGTGNIPATMSPDGVGAFRFLCAPSHNAYDDPIVYPGQPGKAHLHTFFGNDKTDANSTYASLRTSGNGSCNTLLNRSAYWIPAMMHPTGKVIMPDYISIYYKRAPASSKFCAPPYASACLALPRGLRYVFGYNMSNTVKTSPDGDFYWNCDGPGAVSGRFSNIAQAAKGCPVGARIGAIVGAPDCWNGTQLDSADHRSHMAYQQQDGYGRAVCPSTHPYLLPHFTVGAWYTTDASLDRSGDESASSRTWFLASDRMQGMPNAVPGSTLHADWFGAWEDEIQAIWTANCIDKMLNCSGGDLGNGTQLKTTFGYDYPHGRPMLDPPARSTM